jgi:hypothetical protein
MKYRCVTSSISGFVQQIACSYLRHGYWFYVTGIIPPDKDPEELDRKLIRKYQIGISESTRARRKKLNKANVQYLRYERFFVLLATKGEHKFKVEEEKNIRDIRRVPLRFHGYAISYRRGGRTREGEVDPRWHAHVEIERRRYKEIRDHLVEMAKHRRAETLALALYELPFAAYAPIRRQYLLILRSINRVRKAAGFSLLPKEVLMLRRRVVKPFDATSRLQRQPQADSSPSTVA